MDYSVWSDSVTAPDFPPLQNDLKCEALVIGGGMAGILTAYFLKQRGIEAVVVEGKKIGQGITKNTTAVISAQHDTLYHQLAQKHSVEKAKQYLDANLFGVETFLSLARDCSIDCDLEIKPSVIYSKTDRRTMRKEVEFLRRIGFDAQYITDCELPFPIAAGVKFDGMAQFHPLKFLYSLAKKLEIYENTFVTSVKGNTAFTKDFRIDAKHIIVATHFPFIKSKGLYFLKMCQRRSYVLALEGWGGGLQAENKEQIIKLQQSGMALKENGSLQAENRAQIDKELERFNGVGLTESRGQQAENEGISGTYTSYDDDGLYFRGYKNLLLVGGVDRRVGKHIGRRDCGFDKVREFAKKYYPNSTEKYAFSAQDCITLDGVPYIGRYGAPQNLYVTTGFNEWGMTSAAAGARIIADMIAGENNDFARVFSPQRSMLRGQLFKNIGTVLASFVKPTVKRCPHMGCALTFNRKERVWECPCHGSRFDEDGEIIDNPAMNDAKV